MPDSAESTPLGRGPLDSVACRIPLVRSLRTELQLVDMCCEVKDPNSEFFKFADDSLKRALQFIDSPQSGPEAIAASNPIERTFITAQRLRQDLARIGLERGATVMVHSSLRSIGWVLGSAATVVGSLLDVIEASGTLVMPSATPHCADPADWTDPRVPSALLEEAREHLPVFDARTTPTAMGAIAQAFLHWPGTLRSMHPLESVCARGAAARDITRDHPLAFSEGRGGPFEKLYEQDCWILLVGVGFNRCTALHYAESLVEKRRTTSVRFPWIEDGRRVWREVPNVADDNDTHFPVIGRNYLAAKRARLGTLGEARATLFRMRDLVAFAVRYFDAEL